MEETPFPVRLFACLVRQKEEQERDGLEFDERCSRVIVQRLRIRAQGLSISLSFCLFACLFVSNVFSAFTVSNFEC